jgi:cytochrome c553
MNIEGFAGIGRMIHRLVFGQPPKIEVVFDDTPIEHTLKLKWGVCGTCHGRGKHVNPSIDAHGISQEEFEEDPEFEEEYHAGLYDVQCFECHGRTTVLEINEKASSTEAVKATNEIFKDTSSYRSECEAERRMGC